MRATAIRRTRKRPHHRGRCRGYHWHSVLLMLLGLMPLPLSAQSVRGRLVDAEVGNPIELGVVTLLTTEGDSIDAAVTSADGGFSLTASEAGSFLVRASGWGYGGRVDGVFELGEGGRIDIEFRLAPRAMELEEVLVQVDRPLADHRLVQNGFVERYQRGFGHFVTPADLRRNVFIDTEALFRFMPGVRVMPSSNLFATGERVLLRDASVGWCAPAVFIDGIRTQYRPETGLTLSTLVPVGWIEAVEVYVSAAEIPLQYGITSSGTCGVILFWMKR